MQLVHRSDITEYPRCGAKSGHVSICGASAVITCPACLALQHAPIDVSGVEWQIQRTAQQYRESEEK